MTFSISELLHEINYVVNRVSYGADVAAKINEQTMGSKLIFYMRPLNNDMFIRVH